MRNTTYFPIILAIVFSFLTFSCKKDTVLEQGQYVYVDGKLVRLANITTKEVSDVTSSTAVCGGEVASTPGVQVTLRGVCWSNSPMPTIKDMRTTNGEGTGSFKSNITGLMADSTYYVRAYAISENGTAYGEQRVFKTKEAEKPTVTTNLGGVSSTTATCGGNVTSSGGANVTERGVCWGTSQNPTINNNKIPKGSGLGEFVCVITGLTQGHTYYVRAYAINSVGIAYGEEKSFVAMNATPTVTTNSVSNITQTSAVCGGNVTSSGQSNVTARGVCWSTSQNPTVNGSHTTNGNGTGSFTSNMTGLSPNTTYYVKAYATNSQGTSYGLQRTFTTASGQPTVTTNTVSNVTSTTATCGGNVTSDGGATVTARGVCWSTFQNPTINGNYSSHTTNGSGTGSFTSNMTGLSPNTTYYVKAYATNSQGTSYGVQRTFTTTPTSNCPSTVTDYDGNTYSTVQIGSQCWMRQNLRTTHYASGTSIELFSGTFSFAGNRYYPNNSSSNVATYGYLYDWEAVMHGSPSSSANPSGVRGICPNGWHVPSDAEWTQLTDYLSSQTQYRCNYSSDYIAKAMASTTEWSSSSTTCAVGNNPGTNNATGFSALPAGVFYYSYDYFGESAYFWSSTKSNDDYVYIRSLHSNSTNVWRNAYSASYGRSVRCVRD